MATDKEIEDEIQANGKTAARVTADGIQELIIHEQYFNAGEKIHWTEHFNPDKSAIDEQIIGSLRCLTFCVLVLKNGFTVTGESACASPENFDETIGRKIARQNAVNKIWLLEGYLLKQRLYENSKSS